MLQRDFVEVYSKQLSCRSEIVSVRCDLLSKEKDVVRIVNASADGFIQAWTYDTLNRLLPIISICIDKMIPKAVVFRPPNQPKRVVNAFGLTVEDRRSVM